MDDRELLAGFEAGTLTAFPHEDHLRVAYLLVEAHGLDEAEQRMSAGIRAMAERGGAPQKFHVTRTLAWLRLVAARMDAVGPADSRAFLAAHPELLRRDLLDDYYGPGILFTDEARTGWVEPDLRPVS